MLNLTIAHQIYLTRDQRYRIHEGEKLDVVGVSVPVWTENGKTLNEPVQEVFCKYYLSNPRQELPILMLKDGYRIILPYRTGKITNPISDDEWKNLIFNHPEELEAWHKQQIYEVSSKNLLDIKDGGSAHLSYREQNKTKKNNTILSIMHFVNIDDMEFLNNSLFKLKDNLSEEVQFSS